MQSSVETVRLCQSNCTVPPSTVSLAMADYFFPSASWGPVPTSDCCKELTVKLTSFFSSPVLCYLFFLTPVAKYSNGFRKVQLGTKVQNCTNRNRERVGKQCRAKIYAWRSKYEM